MAKGRKKNANAYTSKGERPNVNQKLLNAMGRTISSADRVLNIQKAYLAGRNPWLTIENPNKEETNKRFIKIRANDKYGDPKYRKNNMYTMRGVASE